MASVEQQTAPAGDSTRLTTPDGVPIEDLPGWDPVRQVFVLDRSRTRVPEAARRKAPPVPREARADQAADQHAAR